MDSKLVHPSHQMEDNDYGPDNHCTMMCKTCFYGHCYLCPDGQGMDDDELKAECIGFPHWHGIYDGDKLIGRKSGTGWPKPAKRTTQTT